MSSTSTDPIVKALQPYTSCDCSDALLKLGVVNGGFVSGPTMWSPQRQDGPTKIIGKAYTVQYALNDDPRPKVASHYIDAVPPGSVLFISSPDIPNAVCGGLMSNRAQASGAVGTVVDGRIRDVFEHRGLKYPVFARGLSTASPYELVKVVGTDVPLKLQSGQNLTVNPGDYIVGDVDGVVVIPAQLAEKAIALIAPQVEADAKMHKAIREGMSFTEAGKRFRV